MPPRLTASLPCCGDRPFDLEQEQVDAGDDDATAAVLDGDELLLGDAGDVIAVEPKHGEARPEALIAVLAHEAQAPDFCRGFEPSAHVGCHACRSRRVLGVMTHDHRRYDSA
jgi:hypothetical protein